MAVEVIGKDPKHTYRVTCMNCGSILQFHNSDLHYPRVGDYYKGVTCPECRSFVAVKMPLPIEVRCSV